ncbi:MAG: adenosylcobinamide-GDP ribazoletransferase [Rubrivivax sp.]|nr:adenosylcobinamide-GDP ribazoletransferase [Rubrivivax sp.]
MNDKSPPPAGPLVALAQCLRFYSRLPVPAMPGEADPHALPDFARIPRMLPLAGAIIGSVGAAALVLALRLGMPATVAAAFAIAALVAATGAFHEDGLADTADGFGGGTTVARKLEIMTDSRIGTYGGAALLLSLMLRVLLLAALVAQSGGAVAALALIAVAAVSRVAGLVPVWLLPNAKPDGKSAAVGRPDAQTMARAAVLAAAIGFILLTPAHGVARAAVTLALAAVVVWPLVELSRRMIGGQTGDVAGAAQQVSEIAMLAALVARP